MADADKGPLIVGITALTLILSCVFVFARVITRTLIIHQFGLDDALITVTLCIFTGSCTAWFVAVNYGVGQHYMQLNPDSALAALRATLVGEVLVVWTYPTGKAAVAYLLMRLFPGRTLQWTLWAFVAANAIFFYLNGLFFLVECSPVEFEFNKSIQGGSCWNPEVLVDWGYVTGSVGAATDFAFAVVPWFYISKLQMSPKRKVAFGVSLSAGLLPFVCSILKIYYTSTLGASADPTYSIVNLILTGEAELCAINIAACIPTLHPLYLWCKGQDPRASKSTYSARTPGQGSQSLHMRRFAGRSKNITSGTLLTSFDDDDHDQDHVLRPQSHGCGAEEHGDATSEESNKIGTITSNNV